MKRVLLRFTHLFLLAVFLTAYMGVSITRHTCVSCKTTMYYLFTHEDCCTGHYLTHSTPQESCCSSPSEKSACTKLPENHNHNCCQSEKIYLRLSENVLPAVPLVKTQALVIDLLDAVILNTEPAFASVAHTYKKSLHPDPPPEPTVRQRLTLQTQFVFYA